MVRREYIHITGKVVIITILVLMSGCASLPPNSGNPESFALKDTGDTRLGKAYLELS